MQIEELKKAVKAKTIEFETAMSLEKPHVELLKIYKELKELQFKLVMVTHHLQQTA